MFANDMILVANLEHKFQYNWNSLKEGLIKIKIKITTQHNEEKNIKEKCNSQHNYREKT